MSLFKSAAQPTNVHAHPSGNRCPTCDQPIPNDRLDEVNARITAREQQARAEAEARANEQVRRALADQSAQFAEREAAAREAGMKAASEVLEAKLQEASEGRRAAEVRAAEIVATQEATLNARLSEMRVALEKSRSDAVNAEQAKNAAERTKLENLVDDLKRKLENKSVEELGEGAEVDLFEALKSEFPGDLITRVGRGNAGADVIHEVRNNGVVCGKIVYDSKNHLQWRTDHATKLREDKIAAGANHAVLSTRAFPKDKKQLAIEHGVIIANPARAVVIAFLLRQQIVQLHALKVSNDQRASKTEELYALMTSDRFRQFLDGVEKTAKQLESLQEQERKSHETVWKKQGELYRTIIRTCGQFDHEIARIIGTASDST